MHRLILLLLLGLLPITGLLAQEIPKDSTKAPRPYVPKMSRGFLFDFSYGIQLPFADMATNFEYNFNLGGKIQYILPSNWMLGLQGEWQFGTKVKTDVVANLREPDGSIMDKFGTLSDVNLEQRGIFFGATVGYILPLFSKNRRSGLEFRYTLGYQRHWVRIEVLGSEILSLTDEYKKGYDRMSDGFAMQQYIGYRHLDKRSLLNFFGGFDFGQAFTKNRRGFNYDLNQEDTKMKIDVLIGFRLGLTLPIYLYSTDTENEIYFY